ncbi:MAG: RraA family protein [Thermoleophilia bacterium]
MDRAALRELLPLVSSSALHDVLVRVHDHPCAIVGLATPTPDRVLFGPAATIRFLPYRADLGQRDFARAYYEAVGDDPAGRVLAMSCGGHPDGALAGGKKLTRAAFQGVAGVLTDGRLRDLHELAEAGLAIHATGEAIVPANTLLTPAASGVPVQVRGVTVIPGDWVHADRSGAVVVPAALIERVMHEAAALEEADRAVVERSRDAVADRAASLTGP